MSVTLCIRYRLDPNKLDDFERYAAAWGRIIPRCGGELVGYFLSTDPNDRAVALISFASRDDQVAYSKRIREDSEGAENFKFAADRRLILEEERTILRPIGAGS